MNHSQQSQGLGTGKTLCIANVFFPLWHAKMSAGKNLIQFECNQNELFWAGPQHSCDMMYESVWNPLPWHLPTTVSDFCNLPKQTIRLHTGVGNVYRGRKPTWTSFFDENGECAVNPICTIHCILVLSIGNFIHVSHVNLQFYMLPEWLLCKSHNVNLVGQTELQLTKLNMHQERWNALLVCLIENTVINIYKKTPVHKHTLGL